MKLPVVQLLPLPHIKVKPIIVEQIIGSHLPAEEVKERRKFTG
jgi:hypothetical protein